MSKKFHVVAVTALCFEVQRHVTHEEFDSHGLDKGFTNAVHAEKLAHLAKGEVLVRIAASPGGNVANGIALRGGKAAVIGKIANDDNGKFVAQRLAENGVHYTPILSDKEDATTRSIVVLTTPDKERTFAYVEGVAGHLAPEDIDHAAVSNAHITYLDAYLWDSPQGQEAVSHAAAVAKNAGSRVAIALNDANIVARHRDHFVNLVNTHGDILLGDQREFATLLGTGTFEETVEALHKLGLTASVTAGKEGAYIVAGGTVTHIPTVPVKQIVDTNGAGDAFAAGFMHALADGKTPQQAGRQGAQWASEVIQHIGAEAKIGPRAVQPTKGPRP